MNGTLNRQRWAVDQRKQAQAAFAATVKPVEVEYTARIAELRALAHAMLSVPSMGEARMSVLAEIDRLSR